MESNSRVKHCSGMGSLKMGDLFDGKGDTRVEKNSRVKHSQVWAV